MIQRTILRFTLGNTPSSYINKPNQINKKISLTQLNKYNFSSSSSPKQQFSKTYLLRIQYNNPTDAYYQTYPHRQQFRKQIKKLQDSNKCYIFGGDLFPLDSTLFVINCDQKQLVQKFVHQNVYQNNKLIKKYQIQEVNKISQENMKKLSYFYQYL